MGEAAGVFFMLLALFFAGWAGYDMGREDAGAAPSFPVEPIDFRVPAWVLLGSAMFGLMLGVAWFQPFKSEAGGKE